MPKRSTLEDFIVKAKTAHGDKYNYSKVVYINNRTKVCIICLEHGEFMITPDKHILGRGCPTCTLLEARKARRRTVADFIFLARSVHGNKYDYDKVDYQGNKVKVCITCPEHGNFWQVPNSHLSGKGCPVCGRIQANKSESYSLDKFISKARTKHGNKYDYSLVEYTNSQTKIKIICPKHGVFEQVPSQHLYGNGCPQCALEYVGIVLRDTAEDFIIKARAKHGDKYDYSFVEYISSQTKVKIICPKHGVFEQTPNNHLRGQKCPVCALEIRRLKRTDTKNEFISKAKKVHGDIYNYDNVIYNHSKSLVAISCSKHGVFKQMAYSHIAGHGCPKCVHQISKGEQEMMDWIKQYFLDACHATRILAGKDIDIYIPSKKFGIEYNGIYFHSAQFRDKYDHLRKLETAQQLGIRLMQFWDFEWENKKDIVKSIILNALGIHSERAFARNTEVEEITSRQARAFCEENHIHGFRAANKYLGLAQNGVLLAMMSWNTDGEMVRFVVKNGYSVLGAFSKLLRYSSVTYSFVDRRIFTGAGYLKNGFFLQKITQPNYFYESDGQYAGSRQTYQKHKLSKLLPIFDSSLTEMQNMANNDYYPVYDCGNLMLIRQEESTED